MAPGFVGIIQLHGCQSGAEVFDVAARHRHRLVREARQDVDHTPAGFRGAELVTLHLDEEIAGEEAEL